MSCTYISIALQPELLFALKPPVVESRVLAGSRTKRTISYEYNIPRNPDSEDIVSCTGGYDDEGICYLHHESSLTPRVAADSAARSARVMGRNGHIPEMRIRNMMMRSSCEFASLPMSHVTHDCCTAVHVTCHGLQYNSHVWEK